MPTVASESNAKANGSNNACLREALTGVDGSETCGFVPMLTNHRPDERRGMDRTEDMDGTNTSIAGVSTMTTSLAKERQRRQSDVR